jgi:hypothetical protein
MRGMAAMPERPVTLGAGAAHDLGGTCTDRPPFS